MNTPSNITITISKTAEGLSFTGTSSCNSYLGIINLINTERLRLENIGFTERGCLSEELASFETRYTSILGKVSNYGLEREGLILFFDTTYLIFKPQEN